MVFSSELFLFYFLPFILLIYNICPKKYKNFVLFVFSLVFYSWGEPIYVLLMLFSTFNDFFLGNQIYKNLDNNKSKKFLIISIIVNLFILGFFKYSDFIISILNNIFSLSLKYLDLPLPIGISFYTFQTMSYSIDIYRRQAKPQKRIIDFGLYVCLFPQLIAGPIVRYNEIEKELVDRKENLKDGIEIFILGLSKKILLANNIGILWDSLREYNSSYIGAWGAIIAYSFQIYFDFSGYSDMAIGLGKMFGFNFNINFNYPYISKSITEFWRRWHISLGTWFKEYVYIPLGGNRKGIKRQILNILVVWILTGIWHGANFNFIIWGFYFGIILLIEKLLLNKIWDKIPNFIQHIYSLFLIIIGWAIFAIEDFNEFFIFFKSLFINNSIYDSFSLYEILNNIGLIILCILFSTPIMNKIYGRFSKNCIFKNLILIVLFILNIAFLVSSSYNPFLYFRF